MASYYKGVADSAAQSVSKEKLRISFEYLDWDCKEFFFHGLEPSYYQKVFSCITELKNSREEDITSQTHLSLSPKSIFNTSTSTFHCFPKRVLEKVSSKLKPQAKNNEDAINQALEMMGRAFEICPSKNFGRLHGFVWNNIFHIVWFDPAHNLYPMGNKIQKHKDVATVRCFDGSEVKRLKEENLKLLDQLAEYEELLESQTNPSSS